MRYCVSADYSPYGHSEQSWARLKLEAPNSILVSHGGGRRPKYIDCPLLSQLCQQESGCEVSRWYSSTQMWIANIRKQQLNLRYHDAGLIVIEFYGLLLLAALNLNHSLVQHIQATHILYIHLFLSHLCYQIRWLNVLM